MRLVSLSRHDDQNFDLFVVPEHAFRNERFSVMVPIDTDFETIHTAALNLAGYIKLFEWGEALVDRKNLRQIHRNLLWRMQVERNRPNFNDPVYQAEIRQRARERMPLMEPTAEDTARELLRALDPELLALMEQGVAFYFATSTHIYIWHPNDRAIISLDEDRPHYVCVHSTDHAVESNKYDWAITMRTYLLGAETHWRNKANFHNEYRLRGGKDAFATKDIVPNDR